MTTSHSNESNRTHARWCWLVGLVMALGLCMSTAACSRVGMTGTTDGMKQPIDFQHKVHSVYFSSGKHRQEKIQMHLDIGFSEAPQELLAGECDACHTDLAERQSCAGCHVLFQDKTLRSRSEIRPCVGCHRQAWSGYLASIPSAGVCRTCHGEKSLTDTREEKRLQAILARGEDLPWIQVNALDPHVHFSHKAHVRYGSIGCSRCHEGMAERTSPPVVAANFSMNACMACHEQNHASNDCLKCHK